VHLKKPSRSQWYIENHASIDLDQRCTADRGCARDPLKLAVDFELTFNLGGLGKTCAGFLFFCRASRNESLRCAGLGRSCCARVLGSLLLLRMGCAYYSGSDRVWCMDVHKARYDFSFSRKVFLTPTLRCLRLKLRSLLQGFWRSS
jgi:hypothetical protein